MAAVTIKASAEAFATTWGARVLWDTGSALYAVVQDSGASPRVRVMKANSRTAPTSFSEQDSGNNKAGVQNLSFDSFWDGTYLHVAYHSATNTVTHAKFNPTTDTWATGLGNASTTIIGTKNIRVAVIPGDGHVVVAGTNSTDDADLRYSMHNGTSWAEALFLSVNSASASYVQEIVVTGSYAWFLYIDIANGDQSRRSLTGTTLGTEADFSTSASTASFIAARYNPYTISGTTYVDIIVGDLSSGTFDYVTTINGATFTPSFGAIPSAAELGRFSTWYDTAAGKTYWYGTNGTNVGYVTKTGNGTNAWSSITVLVSSATAIELAPVGVGCAYVYQDGSNNVKMDVLVPFAAVGDTGTVSTGSLSVSGQAIGANPRVHGAVATGNHTVEAQAVAGRAGSKGVVNTGSRVVEGQAIAARSGSKGTLNTGSHTVEGQPVGVNPHAYGAVATGNHTVEGQAIAGRAGIIAVIATGSHVVDGQAIGANPHAAGILTTGDLFVAGQIVAARAGAVGLVNTGSHAVSDQAVASRAGVLAAIATGALAVDGQAITARAATLAALLTGAYAVSGQPITANPHALAVLTTGALFVAGQSIAARAGALAAILSGALSVEGQSISGRTGTLAQIGTGSHSVDGQPVGASYPDNQDATGIVTTGMLAISGQPILSIAGTLAGILSGDLAVSGQLVDGRAGSVAQINTGSYASDAGTILGSVTIGAIIGASELFVAGGSVDAYAGTVADISAGDLAIIGQLISGRFTGGPPPAGAIITGDGIVAVTVGDAALSLRAQSDELAAVIAGSNGIAANWKETP